MHRGNLHHIIRMPKTIYRRIDASSAKYLIVLHCNAIPGGLEHFSVTADCMATKQGVFTHISGSDSF